MKQGIVRKAILCCLFPALNWISAGSLPARTVVGGTNQAGELLARLQHEADQESRLSIYAALLARMPQQGDATLLSLQCADETSADLSFACSAVVALAWPLGKQPAVEQEPADTAMRAAWLVLQARQLAPEGAMNRQLALAVAELLPRTTTVSRQTPTVDTVLLDLLEGSSVEFPAIRTKQLGATLLLAEAIRLGPEEEKARIIHLLAEMLAIARLESYSGPVERTLCRILGWPDLAPSLVFGAGSRLTRTEILHLAQLPCVRLGPQFLALILGGLASESGDRLLAIRALGRGPSLPEGVAGKLREILIMDKSVEVRWAAIEVLGSRERRVLEAILPLLDQRDPAAAEHARQVLALVELQNASKRQ